MNWDTIRFGDLYAEDSRNGLTKPSKVRGSGFKMINMGELFANDRIYDIPMELVPLKESEKKSSKVEIGDLLFARQSLVLEGAGKCSIVMEVSPLTVFESHIIRVRLNKKKANPLFYYYYFKSPFSPVSSIVSQCAQAGIRGSELQELGVIYPDIQIQNKIAEILSKYDEFIENTQKRISLLEELNQRLYKEWFVNYRYPGHESDEIEDGIPKNWEKKRLGDVISYEIGGGWGEDSATGKNDIEGYVIRGTDFSGLYDGAIRTIPLRFHTESNIKSRVLCHGDIVFEVSGGSRTEGVARTVRIDQLMLDRLGKKVICASFCKLIRPESDNISQYLFDHLRYLRASKQTEEFDKRSASSIVNFRWKDFLEQREVVIPDEATLHNYNAIAEKVYKEIVQLSIQIETAKDFRDRLIPRLYMGEIEL